MKKVLKEVFSTALCILAALLLSFLVIRYVGVRTEVIGSSMNDTLIDGENLVVDKISYRFGDPERYDIVVFPDQENDEFFYIKRVIGLPGETIYIDSEGNIYIDDELLEEDYGRETIMNPGRAREPVTLGQDEYFVMGDNRNNSMDSRTYDVGNVKRSELIGKVWIRIWPFSKFGPVRHQ